MKKVLLGCGVVSLVLVIVVGALAYYFVYLPGKQFIEGGMESVAQLQEAQNLNEQIRNKSAFTPPGNGELTSAQVDRFVKVQQSVKARLGPRLKELDAKYAALEDEGGEPESLSDVMKGLQTLGGGLKDLGALMLDTKRAQVEALNEHGFSLQEYQWTRNTVYAALGMPLQEGLGEAVRRAAEEGRAMPDVFDQFNRAIPEINRRLVEPHAEVLAETVTLAIFDLGM